MSGHERPLNGADSEPLSAFDRSCDECLRTIYGEELHQVYDRDGRNILLCQSCYESFVPEPPVTIAGKAVMYYVKRRLDRPDQAILARLIRAAEKEAAA